MGSSQAISKAGLVLVSKARCHLCDEARLVVARLASEFGVDFQELSIATDPALAERYFELIPVVILNGEVVAHWWVDEGELRAALDCLAGE